MSRRLFILEEVRRNIDLTSAHELGEVLHLYNASERRPGLFDVDEFVDAVEERLNTVDFDPTVDAFIIAGSMIAVTLASMAVTRYAAANDYTHVNLLLFDSRSNKYVERRMTTSAYAHRKDIAHA